MDPEIEKERKKFLSGLKSAIDPEQLFPDPDSGFPTNLGGIHWTVTANSIPFELNARLNTDPGALASRLTMVSTPYPDDNYRRTFADFMWGELRHRFAATPMAQSCKQKFDEVLEYDVNHWRKSNKRLGARGLQKFFENFENAVAAEPLQRGEKHCNGFNVSHEATKINDYLRQPNESLLAYDFSDKVQEVAGNIEEQITRHKINPKVATALRGLIAGAKDEKLPFSERKDNLLNYEKAISFATLENPDRPGEPYFSASEIGQRFHAAIPGMIDVKNETDIQAWEDLTAGLYEKIHKSEGNNKLILISPGPGIDTQPLKLSKVFGAPFLKFKGSEALNVETPASKSLSN